jgi:hypothetical protein
MSLLRSRPLRQKSDKAIVRDRTLNKTKREVLRRSRSCEIQYCQAFRDRLDLHHVWGRGNIIGQPWCDSAACCAVLCHGHHQLVTNHPLCEEQAILEDATLRRLMGRLAGDPDPRPVLYDTADGSRAIRLGVAQTIVEALERAGIEP